MSSILELINFSPLFLASAAPNRTRFRMVPSAPFNNHRLPLRHFFLSHLARTARWCVTLKRMELTKSRVFLAPGEAVLRCLMRAEQRTLQNGQDCGSKELRKIHSPKSKLKK